MFTGLIQCLGEVLYMRRKGGECEFGFRPGFDLSDVKDGESIAVNGACLSVEAHDRAHFSVYASTETMSGTNLGDLAPGSKVNLERALAFGERLGGHLVSGHVDCLATVIEAIPVGQSVRYRFRFPSEFGEQVISKGSVTLDGISLTVNARGPDFLEVNVIPDTLRRTTAGEWRPGYHANMETDLIGKYVLSFMGYAANGESRGGNARTRAGVSRGSAGITAEFLGRNGFLG